MRADTHDGPEQMLHVRGLIHCCSSHVRRSWNSVLQRTAGPYIMARLGLAGMSAFQSLSGAKRTLTKDWPASVRLKQTDHVPDRGADRAVIVLGPHHRKAKHSTNPGTQGGQNLVSP